MTVKHSGALLASITGKHYLDCLQTLSIIFGQPYVAILRNIVEHYCQILSSICGKKRVALLAITM
jgi:hypothetical protein